MRLSWFKALTGLFLAAILSVPAWANNSAPPPGTVNYLEGQAQIGANTLNSKSVGSVELHPGQDLTTHNGKVELLLTPGVFLRVGENSSVQMVSPSLDNTQVKLNSGEAMVEVDEIHKANDIRVLEDGASIQLLKTGLYDFNAGRQQVRVFKGKALVADNDQQVKLGGGHELTLNASGKLKAQKFDKNQYEDSLYRFSSLRSDYLSEASLNAAQTYVVNGWYGPGFAYPGWWWDPWLMGYTFFPGDGLLYSPFGFGFYSPVYIVSAGPIYARPVGHIHAPTGRPAAMARTSGAPPHPAPAPRMEARPAAPMGGFHGGFTGGHSGGGFHH